MPADAPSPLDTVALVRLLKHELSVDFVILAGYLKVSGAVTGKLPWVLMS